MRLHWGAGATSPVTQCTGAPSERKRAANPDHVPACVALNSDHTSGGGHSLFGGSAAATTVARRACTPRLGDPRPTRNARSGPPRPPRGDDVDADARPARDDEPRAAAAAVESREPVTTDAARRAGGRGVPGIARGATAARMFPPRAPHTGILRARASLGEGQARDGVSVLASHGHFSKLLAFSDPVSRDRAQLRRSARKSPKKVRKSPDARPGRKRAAQPFTENRYGHRLWVQNSGHSSVRSFARNVRSFLPWE